MPLTPEPADEAERYRSRLRGALLVAALAIGAVTIVAWPEEFDRRMAASCEGLRTLHVVYPDGEPEVIQAALEQSHAVRSGGELLNEADSEQSIRDLSTIADATYAYDVPGKFGEPLGEEQEQVVAAALRTCEDY